jgi:hypothetical protein
MRKAKASNNPYGFFNQNPSNGNNPNIQPGFLPGYAINPTTGQAYVKTKNGLQAINDQGAEEVAPEMYVLSAGDAIEATKLGLSAAKVGMDMLNNIAESTLPAVKKGTSALAKRMGFWEDISKSTFIQTPYGKSIQSNSEAALQAKVAVENGAWVYRGGKLGRSAGPEGQFWSLENPLNTGYAKKYGLPEENSNFDFVEVAVLKPGTKFITKEAPGIGINDGGGIEVVVNPGEPKLQYFHMPYASPLSFAGGRVGYFVQGIRGLHA